MTNLRSVSMLLVLLFLLAGANLALHYGARERLAIGRQTLVEDLEDICRITLERNGKVSAAIERDELNGG